MLLSAIFTFVTILIILPSLEYFEENSRLFSNFIQILSYLGAGVMILFYIFIFCIYVLLFYRYEKQRYFVHQIRQMIEEIHQTATGHFDKILNIVDQNELGNLGRSINSIIIQAQMAIEEERRAEQIKNDLITNVAHDLRSPLTSIIGYLNLINDDNYRDEVELRYYTQIVHAKAECLHHLLNDLFEYTFVQNKEIPLHADPINLEEMINQLTVQFKIQLEEAGMEIRHFISAQNPVVIGDGDKLARVFENLIQNAIRYGKEGKYIDIKITETEQTVGAEIINYGQAIPSVDLPHIFERFYRVEKSRSQYTGGSGLGLAIVKSIVELHNGKIEVNSSVGKTSFILTFMKMT